MKNKVKILKEREGVNPLRKVITFFKDIIYAIRVKIHSRKKPKEAKMSTWNRKKLAFYILMFAVPVIQFCIFYVYVNFNSIMLAFKDMDVNGNFEFVWFDNLKLVTVDLFTDTSMLNSLKNTGILFLCTMLVGIPLPMVVSYYIYKKRFAHKFFSVILYLPSIMSTLALTIAYKFFCENAIPEMMQKFFGIRQQGLLSAYETAYTTTLIYTLWFGMGSSFMLYASTMGSISESVIESAQLDGVKPWQEFLFIILPHIYPTFVTYVVTNIAVAFTNQMNLYSIYGNNAPVYTQTLGYFLYRKTANADLSEYPYLAAFGIVCTLFCIPVCFVIKKLLEKFGPTTE